MRGNRWATGSLAVRAELADLGVYQVACSSPLMPDGGCYVWIVIEYMRTVGAPACDIRLIETRTQCRRLSPIIVVMRAMMFSTRMIARLMELPFLTRSLMGHFPYGSSKNWRPDQSAEPLFEPNPRRIGSTLFEICISTAKRLKLAELATCDLCHAKRRRCANMQNIVAEHVDATPGRMPPNLHDRHVYK